MLDILFYCTAVVLAVPVLWFVGLMVFFTIAGMMSEYSRPDDHDDNIDQF